MAISLSLLLPYVLITKKLKLPNKQILILAVLAGVICLMLLPFGISRFKIQVPQASCLSI
jgi:hypothetical protein